MSFSASTRQVEVPRRVGAPVLALLLTTFSMFGLGGCATWQGATLYQSGSEALQEGRIEVAIDDLERAADLAPDRSEIQNHLGLAYAAADRREDALAAFRLAEALDCDNRAATVNRERLESEWINSDRIESTGADRDAAAGRLVEESGEQR